MDTYNESVDFACCRAEFTDLFSFFYSCCSDIVEILFYVFEQAYQAVLLYFEALINYSPKQIFLIKAFTVGVIANLFVAATLWKLYGIRINARFRRKGVNQTIEELRKSVSELKLPKAYSPRL